MSNADATQIGGDHYKGAMQHWNALALLGWGYEYYLGNATKYATRYDKKHGAQDVQKAIHYTEKLIELVETGVLPRRFRTTQGFRLNLDTHPGDYVRNVDTEQLVLEYCRSNSCMEAYEALDALFRASGIEDLYDALEALQALHDKVLGIEPAAPPAPPTPEQIATAKVRDAAAVLGAQASPDYVNQDR